MENRGKEERRKRNGRMERGTERETTEGQRRGEKKGEGGHPSPLEKLAHGKGVLELTIATHQTNNPFSLLRQSFSK